MQIQVIGGANVDITASAAGEFRRADSNPGKVTVSWGGVGRNIAHNLALLGDEVSLVTIFGGGLFAPVVADACSKLGIRTDLCEIEADGANSFFVAINDRKGELLGAVADMDATEGMTPAWLSSRMDSINSADAVVADVNISAESLAFLIDNCTPPLFLDAVSAAKAPRIAEAVRLSTRKAFFALKCNSIEYETLAPMMDATISRRYISLGADGLRVEADGQVHTFPALPCTVRSVTGGGDALLAGIVHAGPKASVADSARAGLLCARCAVESPDAVSENIKFLDI